MDLLAVQGALESLLQTTVQSVSSPVLSLLDVRLSPPVNPLAFIDQLLCVDEGCVTGSVVKKPALSVPCGACVSGRATDTDKSVRYQDPVPGRKKAGRFRRWQILNRQIRVGGLLEEVTFDRESGGEIGRAHV